jgi:hypothetical protein
VHLRPPPLRLRYRHGVYINLQGYPDWVPYAAAMARIAPVPSGFTVDEARLLDVVIANRLLGRDRTPDGWVWAHVGASRDLALVPVELHGAFRHRGGVGGLTGPGRGLLDGGGSRVRFRPVQSVADDAVTRFEDWLGVPLPDGYREFLLATNGGVPVEPGVLPGCGMLLDQPLFGLATDDRMQDLAYANLWLRDRLAPGFLGIGWVQGGLLVLRTGGEAPGSIWFWDDDDPRDDERYEPAVICRDLLVPCAADMPALLAALTTVPLALTEVAARAIDRGHARLIHPDGMGDALPKSRRTAIPAIPA